METIIINPEASNNIVAWNKNENSFYCSEKDVRFATTYNVLNAKSGKSMLFEFKNSTGPEFDPNTKWIYESNTGIKLIVCNDPKITANAAAAYLAAKTGTCKPYMRTN